jgi:hypothetical protein
MTRKSKADQREPKTTVDTSNPVGATHHSGAGYSIGSRWINTTTQREYVCVDATNPATWIDMGAASATFLGLSDTVSGYVGSGEGYLVVQNATDDGLEIVENNAAAVGLGNVANLKNNTAAGSPQTTDGANDGYSIGSRWWNTTLDSEFVCLDPDDAGSTWIETTSGGSGGAFTSLSDTPANYTNYEYGMVRVNSGASALEFLNNKPDATVRPLATNDVDEYYKAGSFWINTTDNHIYCCTDNTNGAAVWRRVSTPFSNYAGTVAPDLDDDIDDGYEVGSLWIDTVLGKTYICYDPDGGEGAEWTQLENAGGSSGASTFLDLTDTPAGPYSSYSGKYVRVETTAPDELIFDDAMSWDNNDWASKAEEINPDPTDWLISETNASGLKQKVQMKNLPQTTASSKGLCPQLSGVSTQFLNGAGSFSVPSGGGGSLGTRLVTVDDPDGGDTGDYATINAAVSGLGGDGGTILLREGVYPISTTIVISSAIRIIGVQENVQIQNNTSGYVIQYTAGCDGSLMENLKFVVGTRDDAIYISGDNVSARQCVFNGVSFFTGSENIVFDNCTFQHTSASETDIVASVTGTNPIVTFRDCYFYGAATEWLLHINATTSGNDIGHVLVSGCRFENNSNAGGVYVEEVYSAVFHGCDFVSLINPNVTYNKPLLYVYGTNDIKQCVIRDCSIRMVDNAGTFNASLVRIHNNGDEEILVDGVTIDLDNAAMTHASASVAPIFIDGVCIRLRGIILENVKLPSSTVTTLDFGAITLDPQIPNAPADFDGSIHISDSFFRKISGTAGDHIDASVICSPSALTGKGNIRITNCHFDGQDQTVEHSSNSNYFIKVAGTSTDESSLEVAHCYFTKGAWCGCVGTIDKGTIIRDCQVMFRDEPDDYLQFAFVASGYYDGTARRSSFCSITGNHIQCQDPRNEPIWVRDFHTAIISNNTVSNIGATLYYEIRVDTTDKAIISGNICTGTIRTDSGVADVTLHGNHADAYSLGQTGTQKPATVADQNVEF